MKKIKLVLTLAVIGIFVLSCKKPGCTDPEATNYDAKAKPNDLLCTYTSSILLWYNSATGEQLEDIDTEQILYFIDDAQIDSLKLTAKGIENEPACGASKFMTLNSELGLSDFKYVKLRIETRIEESGPGIMLLDSIVLLKANDCLKIKLEK